MKLDVDRATEADRNVIAWVHRFAYIEDSLRPNKQKCVSGNHFHSLGRMGRALSYFII